MPVLKGCGSGKKILEVKMGFSGSGPSMFIHPCNSGSRQTMGMLRLEIDSPISQKENKICDTVYLQYA